MRPISRKYTNKERIAEMGEQDRVFLGGAKVANSKSVETDREELIEKFETRRKALGISKRSLAIQAGLEPSYYQHWVSGNFEFPTAPRRDALNRALDRLEKVKRFNDDLLGEEN